MTFEHINNPKSLLATKKLIDSIRSSQRGSYVHMIGCFVVLKKVPFDIYNKIALLYAPIDRTPIDILSRVQKLSTKHQGGHNRMSHNCPVNCARMYYAFCSRRISNKLITSFIKFR